MSSGTTIDQSRRDLVREVMRDDVRAVLADQANRQGRRASGQGDGYLAVEGRSLRRRRTGTLRRWIRTGRLPVRRAGRVYRVGRAELEDFLAREGRAADIAERARAILSRDEDD